MFDRAIPFSPLTIPDYRVFAGSKDVEVSEDGASIPDSLIADDFDLMTQLDPVPP